MQVYYQAHLFLAEFDGHFQLRFPAYTSSCSMSLYIPHVPLCLPKWASTIYIEQIPLGMHHVHNKLLSLPFQIICLSCTTHAWKHPVSNPNSNHTKPTAQSSWILAITDFSTIRALKHYMDTLGIDAMFLRLFTFGHCIVCPPDYGF